MPDKPTLEDFLGETDDTAPYSLDYIPEPTFQTEEEEDEVLDAYNPNYIPGVEASPGDISEDAGTEDTQEPFKGDLGFFDVVAGRLGDTPLLRPFTRAIRDIDGASLEAMGLIDEAPERVPMTESLLPLEDIPENQLSTAVLTDIAGETLSGAMLMQAYLGRTGPAGRVAGAAVGGTIGAARGTLRAMRTSRAIQEARKLNGTTLIDEAIKRASKRRFSTFIDDSFDDMSTMAQNNPLTFIGMEMSPLTTATALGVGAAESTSGDRNAEVQMTGVGALIGSLTSPMSIIAGLSKLGSAGANSAKRIKNFFFMGGKEEKIRGQAVARLKMIAEDAGYSLEGALAAIDDSIDQAAKSSVDRIELEDIALRGETTFDNLKEILKNDDRAEAFVVSTFGDEIDNPAEYVTELRQTLGRANQFEAAAESLPVGNLTGNDFLVALQRRSSTVSRESSGKDKTNLQIFTDGLLEMEARLRQTGDPNNIRLAAELRKTAFEDILNNRMSRAREVALAELRGLAPQTGSLSDIRRGASRRAYESLENALHEARMTESAMHSRLGEGINITSEQLAPLRNSLDTASERLRDFYSELPGIKKVEALLEEGGDVPYIMQLLRSRLMDKERALRSQKEYKAARDLRETLIRPLKDVIDAQDIPGLEPAREFSRAMHKTFGNAIVDRYLSTNPQGALRIDPEELLIVALRGDTDQAAIRLDRIISAGIFGDRSAIMRQTISRNSRSRGVMRRAVEEANEFVQEIPMTQLTNDLLGFEGEFGPAIMRETDLFVRALAQEFQDAEGNVDINGLVRYVKEQGGLVEKFPDLQRDLSNARTAALRINRVNDQNTYLNSTTMERRLFGGLLGVDNPTPMMQRVLNNPNRRRHLRNMAGTAKAMRREATSTGEDGARVTVDQAMAGLRSTVLDAVYMNSKQGDSFRWDVYKSELFTPRVGSKDSLVDQLQEFGILDAKGRERLEAMVNLGAKVQRSMDNPAELDSTVFNTGTTNALQEGLIAVGGSTVFGGVAKKLKSMFGMEQVSGDIVANQAGATAFRNFFIKRGEAEVLDLIMAATSDAKLFKALFEEFDATSLDSAGQALELLKAAAMSSSFRAFGGVDINAEYDEAAELPSIENLMVPEEQEEEPAPPPTDPDFFEQFRGAQ